MKGAWGRSTPCVLIALAATSVARESPAQTQVEGFALPRFDTSYAGDRLFAIPDGIVCGHAAPDAKLTLDYAHAPLKVRTSAASDAVIVRHQVYLHTDIAYSVAECVKFAIRVPVALVQSGEVTGLAPSAKAGLGDIRLGARLVLWGDAETPFALAAQADVWLPTGSVNNFTSDGTVRAHPRLVASGLLGSSLFYGAALGAIVRPPHDIGLRTLRSGMSFAAGGGLLLWNRSLQIGPEVYGETSFGTKSTALEALVGAHQCLSSTLVVGAGAGLGFTGAPGVPDFRGLVSFAYEPNRCEPARAALDAHRTASPPAPEREGDHHPQEANATEAPPGVEHAEAAHDEHGPTENGVAEHGPVEHATGSHAPVAPPRSAPPRAPAPPVGPDRGRDRDRDRDGIADADDACPDTPGVRSDNPRDHGCPEPIDTFTTSTEVAIQQQVRFEVGEAVITAESERVLRAVATILRDHPEITNITIEGHTDSTGPRQHNLRLSERRALAVRNSLLMLGVAASRLTIKGFGPDIPAASNQTSAGRQKNRVVLLIPPDSASRPAHR